MDEQRTRGWGCPRNKPGPALAWGSGHGVRGFGAGGAELGGLTPVPTLSLGTPALSPQHPKAVPTHGTSTKPSASACPGLLHQQRARQGQMKPRVTNETGTGDTGPAARHMQLLSSPKSRDTRGIRERPSGGCRHTLPPAGDPGCALRNAEATQCKFFGFVAAAPLPWSRRREQTQLAPCFLSTFHPTAPAPALATPGLSWLCQCHIPPVPGQPRWSRAASRQPWGREARSWFRDRQGTPEAGRGWRGDGDLDRNVAWNG